MATEALQQATAEDHVERARALMSLAKSVGFLVGMDEGHSLAEQAVGEVRDAEESIAPLVKANLIQSLGQICWWHGYPQSIVRYCEEALRIMPDRLDPIVARTYITLVSPYLYWRDFEKALEYAEQGLKSSYVAVATLRTSLSSYLKVLTHNCRFGWGGEYRVRAFDGGVSVSSKVGNGIGKKRWG